MNIRYVNQENGPKLGYCPESGVTILERDGLKFKDLSKTGKLLPYEDWQIGRAHV